uniref:Senescence-associated protein n=1 Tax=Salix viminalis TaxID=40686 RepID=A0A6N2NIM9_SALVM
MNAWLPQASYPCGNFSDTSSFKFRRSKGSIGHAFTVRIRTGNQNQTSFYPFVPHEISVLVELILGHLRYLLTDVPPQPNSPPDNVFRPDRPPKRPWVQKEGQRPASDSRNNQAQQGLLSPLIRQARSLAVVRWIVDRDNDEAFGYLKRVIVTPAVYRAWLNFFTLTFRALGRNHIARIPLVRTSSESTVRRPGKAPERAVPSPSPGRHATTRSRRGSSSSSPPTADGFGTGTPRAQPSEPILFPRGCSPWRPDAVMSTTGRGRHSVLRIFKGRRGRTGHHATCGALPAAGPYLRLSRFQGILTRFPFEARARTRCRTGFPRLLGSTNPCASAVHMEPFPSSAFKFSFEYLLLPPRSAPTAAPPVASRRRALLLIGAWRLPRRPGIGRALQRHPFSGLVDSAADFDFHDHRPAVSAQLGTVTRLPVHPASPVLLTKNGPLGALDSVARLNEAAAPSYLFKGNFGGNQLLDGSISLSPLSQVRRCTSVSLRASTRVSSGFAPLRHSSPSFGSRQACSHSNPSQKIKVGRRCNPRGDPASQLPCALRVYSPVDSHTCQTPWSVFQDGTNGEPTGDARSAHVPGHAVTARAAVHDRSDGISTGAATAIRIGPRPEPIGGPAVAVPHPTGAHRRPSTSLDIALTALFKVLFIFPSPPWTEFTARLGLHSQTTRLADSASCAAGPVTTGLSPSPAPLPGTWAWSAAEDASPDYNSNAAGARFSSWAFPGSLAVTRESLSLNHRCRRRGLDFRPTTGGSARETSIRPRPREPRGVGRRCVTPRQTCPRPGGLGRNLRSKTRWFTGFCNSHQVSHFATFFIDARAEISVAESRSDYHKKKARPRHRGYEGGLLVLNFLGASRAGVRWRAVSGADASLHGTRGHEGGCPRAQLVMPRVRGSFCRGRFRQVRSPTETLLRLLLPLNDKVQWTSRDVASGEPPTSPRSEHFTGPFNR